MRRSRIKLALILIFLAALGLLLWQPIQQARAVAAVQDSLDRAWEITFGDQDKPIALPDWLDDKTSEVLTRIFRYDPDNRYSIHRARFRSLFRGPIEFIGIYYPENIRGDLGATLRRFPHLRRFTFFENEDDFPTEADMTLLCTRLRSLPKLEEIELGGGQLTDAALAQLAGHPGLRTVEISFSQLTPACAATFATMPRLTSLIIGQVIPANPGPLELSEKDKDAIRTALPHVKIEF